MNFLIAIVFVCLVMHELGGLTESAGEAAAGRIASDDPDFVNHNNNGRFDNVDLISNFQIRS